MLRCQSLLFLKIIKHLRDELDNSFNHMFYRLSGLSPFMADTEPETLSNVTTATWDFNAEEFENISAEAKDFISKLLIKDTRYIHFCTLLLLLLRIVYIYVTWSLNITNQWLFRHFKKVYVCRCICSVYSAHCNFVVILSKSH